MTSPETDDNIVYVSMGSNIAPEDNLKAAVTSLRQHCPGLALSHVYRTPPQGYTQQADFLNMAVKLKTSLTPEQFKQQVIGSIERELKRVRDPNNKNAPRTIDLDIALWGDTAFDYGDKPWHVPERDIIRFAHVAVPLADIAPDYVHPETGDTLKIIADRFDTTHMQRAALDI